MADITRQLKERLDPHVKKIEAGNGDDHDWLPSLFWAVLDQHQKLNASIQSLLQQIQTQQTTNEKNDQQLNKKLADLLDLFVEQSKVLVEIQPHFESAIKTLGKNLEEHTSKLISLSDELRAGNEKAAKNLENKLIEISEELKLSNQTTFRNIENKLVELSTKHLNELTVRMRKVEYYCIGLAILLVLALIRLFLMK